MDITTRLNDINNRIANGLKAGQRENEEVLLVAVTKNQDVTSIQKVIDNGIIHIGENRVQELIKKYDEIKGAKWHFIGNLQRNKVKYIIDKVYMIHSLDRLPLAKEINKQAAKLNRIMPVLVQINIAKEATKSGLAYEEAVEFIEGLKDYPYLRVMGLMTMAPLVDNPEKVRPYFKQMKDLFDQLKGKNFPHTDIKYLSMGMTNDYEVAISEGSNLVRVGRAIFT